MDLGVLRELAWRIDAKNPDSLLDQIADSSSWWLPASRPQFKILGTIIVPLPVSMMYFFLR
jgi:hypothetical protein